MSQPFLSEIRMMSFNFAPRGWALCNGQLLPINQNQALFSLLGTTYGGNGQVNFALPDLRGRVPVHFGSGRTLGESAGEAAHTLNLQEMPTHAHVLQASSALATTSTPLATDVLARTTGSALYASAASANISMAPNAITPNGGSQAHENRQPFLTISFCIALQGIFPSPN
ncbi:phage tail protein [Dokdonella sp. MW10]|uniref:phage tail protein n=1 Tax=Dokdonella sp. MW10 TaxID=2992926 RepID=UPI003F7F8080